MELAEAISILEKFVGVDLSSSIASAEASLIGIERDSLPSVVANLGATDDVLTAAGLIKAAAGQINVVLHALGILRCLPHILQPGEKLDYVSLGAGNSGRPFDLETNQRVAEFKFINWRGGPEAIRQNALFKDFYLLAAYPGPKRKFLYVLGTKYPLKFFNSRRSLASVLSHNARLKDQFTAQFGARYEKVSDYYTAHQQEVRIEDVSQWLPELAVAGSNEEEEL
jgi:hypothetical protein